MAVTPSTVARKLNVWSPRSEASGVQRNMASPLAYGVIVGDQVAAGHVEVGVVGEVGARGVGAQHDGELDADDGRLRADGVERGRAVRAAADEQRQRQDQ